ncbi:MAG: hypothetical protein C4536_09010, partial [Actinobacteria bacterium]
MLLPVFLVSMLVLTGSSSPPALSAQRTFAWTQLNTNGFGRPANIGCLGMSVNEDQLYLGTWTTFIGASVMRYDGAQFTTIASGGFENLANYAAGTVVHDGTVYAGTFNIVTGCEVWRYDGGTSWTRVDGGTSPGNGGFGDARNTGTYSAASHGGSLYIGTQNATTGGEVWRYDGGTSWTRVDGGTSPGNGGFGDATNRACHIQTYGGHLYASTQNLTTGCEVWRYDGGTSWTRVDGGTSPGNGGFGDANTEVCGLIEYDMSLYAYTTNFTTGCEVWRYDGGTSWTRVDGGTSPGNGGFGDASNTELYSATVYNGRLIGGTGNIQGCEIWSYDGAAWERIADNGIDGTQNHTAESLAACQGNLFVGTGNNSTGTEIWTTKTAPAWYLAEGATAGGFETWVLVQNPNPEAVEVDFTLN